MKDMTPQIQKTQCIGLPTSQTLQSKPEIVESFLQMLSENLAVKLKLCTDMMKGQLTLDGEHTV